MNVKGFYTGLAGIIAREERQKLRANEEQDKLVATWEIESSKYSEHWRQRGEPIASNLRGTPADCMKAESLRADLAWVISKARGEQSTVDYLTQGFTDSERQEWIRTHNTITGKPL